MPTLVILAAGMARRFGAPKQLTPVGPRGETIIEYNVHDALEAGFDRVVLVIREELRADLDSLIVRSFGGLVATELAFQRIPIGRDKPLGSAEAVLAASGQVDGPFAVANCDDIYGPRAFQILADGLRSETEDGTVIAYRLADTVPLAGRVTRALLEVDGQRVTDLVEVPGLGRDSSGQLTAADGRRIEGQEWVSMNLWGLPGFVMAHFGDAVSGFAAGAGPTEEIFLPEVVMALARSSVLELRWAGSGEPWTGLTNPDDLESVRAFLSVHRPDPLWR